MSARCLGFFLIIIFSVRLSASEKYFNMNQRALSEESFKTGYYYFNNMDYEASISFFRQSITDFEDNDKTWYWLGKSYLLAGYTNQAIKAWEQLKRLKQNDIFVEHQLEGLYSEDVRRDSKYSKNSRYTFLRSLNTRSNPIAINFDKYNSFYVTDYTQNKIDIYNTNLHYITSIKNKLEHPYGVSFFDNLMFVPYFGSDKVVVYDAESYKKIFEIGGFGFQEGKFAGPTNSFVYHKKLYVVDQGNSRIQTFQIFPKPYFVGMFGKKGSGPGEFLLPVDVTVYKNKIWVADQGNKRIQIFDLSGNYLSQIKDPRIQKVNRLFLYQNIIYIVDENNGLLSCNPDSKEIQVVKKPGQGLQKIQSAIIDKTGNLFFSEFTNPKVVAYTLESSKLTSLKIQTLFSSSNGYPKVMFKLRVQDAKGKDITGLERSNFAVSQNGKTIHALSVVPVKPEEDKISVSFILKATSKMKQYKQEIKNFLKEILPSFRNVDEVRLIVYNSDKDDTVLEFTKKRNMLIKKVDLIKWKKEESISDNMLGKVLYKAIHSGLKNDAHNAIILLTDGEESGEFKKHSAENVANYAFQMGLPIYTLGFGNKDQSSLSLLKVINKKSQGKYLNYYKNNGVYDILNDIRANFALFYTISYNAPRPKNGEEPEQWQNVIINLDYRGLYGREQVGFYTPK